MLNPLNIKRNSCQMLPYVAICCRMLLHVAICCKILYKVLSWLSVDCHNLPFLRLPSSINQLFKETFRSEPSNISQLFFFQHSDNFQGNTRIMFNFSRKHFALSSQNFSTVFFNTRIIFTKVERGPRSCF